MLIKRIELLSTGHIQFRDIKEDIYHRSVIDPDEDDFTLPEKCEIAIQGKDKILKNADVSKVIKEWRNTAEIKKAIKKWKDKGDL